MEDLRRLLNGELETSMQDTLLIRMPEWRQPCLLSREQMLDLCVSRSCEERSNASRKREQKLILAFTALVHNYEAEMEYSAFESWFTHGIRCYVPEAEIVNPSRYLEHELKRRQLALVGEGMFKDRTPDGRDLCYYLEMLYAVQRLKKAVHVLQTKLRWIVAAHKIKPQELFEGDDSKQRKRRREADIQEIFDE